MSDFIAQVASAAIDRAPLVLGALNISVPPNGRHGPCPSCGGKDRFRFDNKGGRGTWFCNQCSPQAGDLIDLVCNVNGCNKLDAAHLIAPVIGQDGESLAASGRADRIRRSSSVNSQPEKETERQNGPKSQRAAQAWEKASPVSSGNAYLVSKQVECIGLRQSDRVYSVGGHRFDRGTLIMPLCNSSGQLMAIQLIDTAAKRFIGPTKGCFHILGNPADGDQIWITEGYATGASIHKTTRQAVVVATSANTLPEVAQAIHQLYDDKEICIAADHDQNGTGEKFAKKAADLVKGFVAVPPDILGDWNDYAMEYGNDALLTCLLELLTNQEEQSARTCTRSTENPVISGLQPGTGQSTTCATSTAPEPPDSVNSAHSPDETIGTIGGWALVNPEQDLPRLREINRQCTHVATQGKHVVVQQRPCAVNGKSYTFERLNEFENHFLHKNSVIVRCPDSGRSRRYSLGSAWLRWTEKRFCPKGIDYYPQESGPPPGVFNMYTGLAIYPMEGDCSIWLKHLRDVICAGNEKAYKYCLQWFAHMIQRPDEKPSVALVLKSCEGAGKGTLVEPILRMLGAHGLQVNGTSQVAGRFNSSLADKQLLYIDEADATNRVEADRLKAIISESRLMLEHKGLDAVPMANYSRLIFASNRDRVLVAGSRERRYMVLEPDEKQAQSKEYFSALWDWIDNQGGPAKLLDYLLNVGLDGFDPRRCPATKGLISEQLNSLTPIQQFFYEHAINNEPFMGKVRMTAGELVKDYMSWCEMRSIRASAPQARSLIGKQLSRMGLKALGRSGRDDGKFYQLPTADELRAALAKSLDTTEDELF